MSVVSVYGPRSRPGTFALGGERTYTATYIVTTDSASDGPITVSNAAGVAIGATYSLGNDTDARAYCKSKSVEQVSSDDASELKTWMLTDQYSTLDKEDQKKLVHPLSRPYEITYGFEHFQEVVEADIAGGAILNAAQEYFDPPIERDASRPVLTIVRNEAAFPAGSFSLYQDAVNSDVFQGQPPDKWKVFNIGGQRVIEEFANAEVEYWKVTYEFHHNRNGWKRFILNQGRSEIVNGVKKKIKFAEDGTQVIDPVLLDLDGARVPEGGPHTFIGFNLYLQLPFAAFNF